MQSHSEMRLARSAQTPPLWVTLVDLLVELLPLPPLRPPVSTCRLMSSYQDRPVRPAHCHALTASVHLARPSPLKGHG